MYQRLLKYLWFAPLLLSFQCDEDEQPQFVYNTYSAEVTPLSTFSLEDTIWISGKVSSNIFDLSSTDSAFTENPLPDDFSVYKFIEPTDVINCIDAIDNFELIIGKGEVSFIPICENATLQAFPEIVDNNQSYSYRIGLQPKTKGAYVISWRDGNLQNSNRHEFIVEKYPISNHPNKIGFNTCGNVSWRVLSESKREYYFMVE